MAYNIRWITRKTTPEVSKVIDRQLAKTIRRDEKNRFAHGMGQHDLRRVPTCPDCPRA